MEQALGINLAQALAADEQYLNDYLQNEELLNKTLNECISGALNDEHKCQTVKGAYANIDSFKNGSLSEEHLKMLGKK
ncbi:hypothetical protein FXE05_03845 [Aggregatibacter actinomycetemcomitans]|nr:hypothetical protein FXE10_04530 [Aggregatibacter actinomycetemcomitans]TYA25642.1 hypothetical protein FXE05_03845 [Aggregatibacter actinomycetemcomitans]TYA33345.1 hypothetical protein FXB69_03440 [Aggregatibacter actinomycetemcomitans]TYB01474.1 hypothetical protein FXB93_04450 [Aggregatibacter actinomycetemcomitans]TYB15739.1 hypothetical protein FXB65_04510 [Aggregatibacter actinomycetemcomitans]